ncbi:MAG TPA: ABC transporter ATP-binding protein [Acidimicrobiales bacterium]|nr:ABC transporter ATP-binding protein [Acidimicrobiales bacterium]
MADSATAPALSVRGLTKHFGERTAYRDITFDVGQGEVFGLLGPNGAGKTTTVRTLGTLLRPSSGTAVVAGVPLGSDDAGVEIRRRIAIMPEAPGLYLRQTVRDNLSFFADLYDIDKPGPHIDRALEAVKLTDRANDMCGSLSKGLRQRVALARALLPRPVVLFLDEPTSGLDPAAARDVHELIDDLRRSGVTVVLTTHRLTEAERLCDRVAILNTTLRTIGRPDELRDRLFSKALVVKLVEPLAHPEAVFSPLAGVESWGGSGPCEYSLVVANTKAVAPSLVRALVSAGADVLSMAERSHSLEDVYMELVGDAPKEERQ